jgi:GNAT superfamily N-acetyltransferase
MNVEPLDERHAAAWVALFDRSASPCFCRWWHFAGTKNEWLARCGDHRELNRDEQRALIGAHSPEATGLVAMDGDRAVGWMKVTPRALLPKLLRLGPYRALPRDPNEPVWAIGCFLVDPERRHQGIASAMIRASVDFVRDRGGSAVEAYPRRSVDALHDEEAWMGTASLFASCGFVQVAGEGPYPVMRREV